MTLFLILFMTPLKRVCGNRNDLKGLFKKRGPKQFIIIIVLMIPSLISLTIRLYTPEGVYCEIHPLIGVKYQYSIF